MTLGKRIYALRTAQRLTQDALAERLGVSRQSISKWETDESVPELEKLVKLSELFGVTLDELVRGESPTAETAASPSLSASGAAPAWSLQRVVGIILLCFAGLMGLLSLCLLGSSGLVLAAPLLVCGVICLTVKRHAGLWCAWTVWLWVELILRQGTGLSGSVVFQTLQWTAEMNYARLATGWIMLIVPVLLMGLTVLCLRRGPFPALKPLPLLLGLAGFVALRWGLLSWLSSQLFQHVLSEMPHDHTAVARFNLFSTAIDWFTAAGLVFWSVAFLRRKRD